MFLLILCTLAAPVSFAQRNFSIDLGIRTGRPLKPVLQIRGSQYDSLLRLTDTIHDPNYTVGPSVAVNLGAHLGVQVDALYKPLRYETTWSDPRTSVASSTGATWWEFPITGKWRFSGQGWQPFAGGGITFSRVKGTTEANVIQIASGTQTRSSSPWRLDDVHLGFVTGGGVELKAGHFRVAPEFRYTHWNRQSYQPGKYAWPNQFDVLLGFAFRRDRSADTQQHKFGSGSWKK